MTSRGLIIAGITLLALGACAKPVPAEKSAYVGEWRAPAMYLLITQDGSVRYKRLKRGATTEINGPLKEFQGDNFAVGVGPMSTTFVVNTPPYQDGNDWLMIVDDVKLKKTAE